MSNIRFASPEHRDFFLDMMGEAGGTTVTTGPFSM